MKYDCFNTFKQMLNFCVLVELAKYFSQCLPKLLCETCCQKSYNENWYFLSSDSILYAVTRRWKLQSPEMEAWAYFHLTFLKRAAISMASPLQEYNPITISVRTVIWVNCSSVFLLQLIGAQFISILIIALALVFTGWAPHQWRLSYLNGSGNEDP